jgi:hypothetical protein
MRSLKIALASVTFVAALIWFSVLGGALLSTYVFHGDPRSVCKQIVAHQREWDRARHGVESDTWVLSDGHTDRYYLAQYIAISTLLGSGGIVATRYLRRRRL